MANYASNQDRPSGKTPFWGRLLGRDESSHAGSPYGEPASLLEPFIVVAIGMALALYDQTASEVSGALRGPALIAGLLLVGQGLTDLQTARKANAAREVAIAERRRREEERKEEKEEEAELRRQQAASGPPTIPMGGRPAATTTEPAKEKPAKEKSEEKPVNKGVDLDATDEGAGALPWVVIGLAIWLGLATLAYPTAPVMLILLSLLAAFLLFTRGWGMIAADRERRAATPPSSR